MAHNSLYPASLRIDYQSAYGLHSMTFPTAKIALDGGVQKYVKEDLTVIGVADTLIAAWVTAIKQFFPPGVTFIGWQAFTYATPTAPAAPYLSGALGVVGTSGGGTIDNSKATQMTYTWRTDEFGIFKIILLDPVMLSSAKITDAASAYVSPLHLIVTTANTWFRGRDGGKPLTFLQLSRTLNEKLRKAYRMN